MKNYGDEEGIKKYNEICYNKGKSNRIEYYIEKFGEKLGKEIYQKRMETISVNNSSVSTLNKQFKELLIENKISFEEEKTLYRTDAEGKCFRYDFLINGKIIVELNGDFWHANPQKYKENDILHFPRRL